jgi:glycosyltransferase involved in cell wall biosynthesis
MSPLATDLKIYLPVYNVAAWAKSFEIPRDVKIVAADNASSDGTADILEKRGIEVIRHQTNIGRVENWEFCLRHFLASQSCWIKLHMAGDTLSPNTYQIWSSAVNSAPSARFIVTDWDICENGHTRPARRVDGYSFVSPLESLRRFAEKGNWVGPPLNVLIHRDLIQDGFDLGNLPFVADMQLFVHCASKTPTLLAPGVIGCFNVSERRFHQAHCNDLESRCQDAIVRYKASKIYRDLSKDEVVFRHLISEIDKEIGKVSIIKNFSTPEESIEQLQILNPIPTSFLIKVIAKRIRSKILKFRNRY